MYGQMTAGSWIYIGSQGIVQGTYECFAEIARRRFGGSLAGTITLTAGLGGMGGAQPLAVTMNEGVALCVEVDPDRIERRLETRYLDERADDLDDAIARCRGRQGGAPRAQRRASARNAADVLPELLGRGFEADVVTDQTSAHDPLVGYVPNLMTPRGGRASCARPTPTSTCAARARRSPPTASRWSASRTPAPRSSTTATACAPRRSSAASSAPSTTRASSPPTSGRCSARARARSAGSRCRATRPTSPPPTARCSRSSPTTRRSRAGSGSPASGSPSRACRRGSAGSATASGARLGLRFNEMVRTGELKAPIVIGRDHLDSGSVASPYRETEAMADGSDAIADWPLLNALVNTAAGASWVSIHHGGGVGIGRSIHAGMVCVADGTELAAEKLERVLTARPRHRRDAPRRRRLRAGAARSPPSAACGSRCAEAVTPAVTGGERPRDRHDRRSGAARARPRGEPRARSALARDPGADRRPDRDDAGGRRRRPRRQPGRRAVRIAVAEVDGVNPRYPYKPPIPLTVIVNPEIEPIGERDVA